MTMDKFCKIRDVYRTIAEFEHRFVDTYGLDMNQGMLLCSLSNCEHEMLSSGSLAETLGLTCSNTSKLIRALEEQGYIERVLGKEDKRQMYFRLSSKGRSKVNTIHCEEIEIPENLEALLQ